MTADNGEERLLNAVEALAASSEPIHRRLRTAGTLLLPLQASDFVEPADAELLEEILRALTGVSDPSGEHGDMVLSAFSMHDDQAVRVAQMICDLLRRIVSSERAPGQP
jgi:hypothetical protein